MAVGDDENDSDYEVLFETGYLGVRSQVYGLPGVQNSHMEID
jgi:hypothetical protein